MDTITGKGDNETKVENSTEAKKDAIEKGKYKPLINLRYLSIGGMIDYDGERWGDSDLRLQGFTYEYLKSPINFDVPPEENYKESIKIKRLKWLSKQYLNGEPENDMDFEPQPFEQIIKVFRRMGWYAQADDILIEKLRYKRKFMATLWQKPFLYIWDHFYGFGIKKWKIITTFIVLWFLGSYATFIANNGSTPFSNKSTINVPFLDTYATGKLRVKEITLKKGVMVKIDDENDDIENTKTNTKLVSTIQNSSTSSDEEIPCGKELNSILYSLDLMIPLLQLNETSSCTISQKENYIIWRYAKAIYTILGWFTTSALIIALTGYFRREVD